MIYESDYFVGSALNGDSLSHHGVPDMRWGERHGPPYPIRDRASAKVHYVISKMTDKTKESLEKSGKIKPANPTKPRESSKVSNAAKSVVSKVGSSFKKWSSDKKEELVSKETNNSAFKNWQKKQLRISNLTNQELKDRIERKRLEATYRHALRGDFSDAKTWYAVEQNKKGKSAANNILQTIGNATVEGIAKGLTARISNSIEARGKGKIDRREAIKNAVAEVKRKAAVERAQNDINQKSEARQRQRELDAFQQALRDEENFRRYSSEFYGQRALPSGSNDMDELWKLYGPSV